MSNNNEATAVKVDSASQTSVAGNAPSSQQGQRAGNPKNPQQKPRREMTPEEKVRLDLLITEKLKNPFAARELLAALEATPGARFVGFRNGFTTQMLKILQDTDRGLSALDRISVMDTSVMNDRHAIERDLAGCMEKLVGVTADIAILANRTAGGSDSQGNGKQGKGKRQRELLVLDSNVKAKMKAKGAPAADDDQSGSQSQAPGQDQVGQLKAA